MASLVTVAELALYGMNSTALAGFTTGEKEAAAEAATSEFECIVGPAYSVPLTSVPVAVKLHIARMAVFHLYAVRGFSPDGRDAVILDNYDRAIAFAKQVQKGQQVLSPTETSSTRIESPQVDSDDERGWESSSGV